MEYRFCYSVEGKGNYYPTLAQAVSAAEKESKITMSFVNYLSLQGRIHSADDLLGDMKRMAHATRSYEIIPYSGMSPSLQEMYYTEDLDNVLSWLVNHLDELAFTDTLVDYGMDKSEYTLRCGAERHEMADPPLWQEVHIIAHYQ